MSTMARILPGTSPCRRSWPLRGRSSVGRSVGRTWVCPVSSRRRFVPKPRRDVWAASTDSAASLDIVPTSPQRGASTANVFVQAWYHLRALCFCAVTFALSVPLFTLMALAAPLVFAFDRNKRRLYAPINTLWAKLSAALFCSVKVEGTEHLASATEPAVYVANHQSYMDIFAFFFLDRPIRFISKTSIFFFPFIGWSMFLTGHVRLNRVDRRSQLKCLRDCQAMLEKDVPIVFFPEGTRSSDKKLLPFKKGAFAIAVKTGVPVIPITLNGTGDLMPKGKELELRHGTIRIVVHPRIESKGRDPLELCQEAQEVVASSLPV